MKKITLVIFMSLMSFLGFAQFPESFDTGIPATWSVMDNGVDAARSWTATNSAFTPTHSGAQHVYVDRGNIGVGNTSEEWLVTPQVTVPTNGQLRFWTKMTLSGDFGTLYQLRVSTTSQSNQASFTTFQQWTEPQLETAIAAGGSTAYNVYGEIVQTLSAYAGQNIYIAFVKVHTQGGTTANPYYGDRWVLDDVNVVQQCNDPSGLGATQISTTTAQLSWTSTGPATSWDVELMLSAATPTGVPTHPGVTNPYPVSGLTAGTQYKYYVRSVCSTGATSNWVGPFIFNTIPYGQTCAAPIAVSTLPYSHTSNTNLYGNVVTGSPGTSCGITGNYLTGNDVFYAFTPSFTGVVDITMTPTANNSGLFVYGSCANVGVSCLAGVANTGMTPRNIPFLSVTAGTTYYIVISSLSGTIPYTLAIQQVGCPPPSTLAASPITQTTATLSWANPGGAAAWEYVYQPAGGGLPPGAGTPTTATSVPVTGLTANTPYEFYVRVDCGGGTYSVWAGPFAFRTLCDPFTVPFTEGFNSTSTTQPCWTVLNVGNDANAWNMDYATNPFEGNQSASIVSSAATNDDWLISPQVTLTGNQRLKFRYRVEASTSPCTFAVRLSTNGPNPADLSTVLIAPTSYNNTTYIERIVNLSAYTGNVNIGWYVAPGANGSRIYIDQVIIEDLPTCPEPTALAVSGIGANTATVQWIPGNTETSWQVLVQPAGSPAPTLPTQGVTVTGAPTYNAPLNSSTSYDVYVLANCGATSSVWIGPVSFRTPQVPGILPFSDTFEGNFDWDTVNGTQTNKWFAGTAVNNGGTRSMYISNNNGAANAYTISPTAATSTVQAFRDIQIPAGANQLNVAFDWRAVGEGTTTKWDYFRVWIVPISYLPTAGTLITAAPDRINISGNINLGSATLFARRNIIVNSTAFAGQIVRVVFEWRNDGIGGAQPPAAIDNIDISVITCPAPSALTVTGVTQNTATVQWTAGAAETQWEIVVQAPGAGQPTGSSTIIPAGTNPFTITGLNPSTNYEYYVRANCGATDGVSTWVGPKTFSTVQVPVTLPYSETFEGASGWTTLNENQANKWFEGTAANNGGTRAIYISNDNAVTNAYTITTTSVAQMYRDIQIPAGTNQINVAFDWRAVGQANADYFRVWAVPASFNPTAGTQITAAADRFNVGGDINQGAAWTRRNIVVNATAFAGQTMRLVFEWRNDAFTGTQPPAAIDNVDVTVITCPAPTAPTVTGVTQNTATVQWTAGASETAWEIVVQPVASGQPTGSSTIIPAGTNPYTITGLNPSTNYEYYVRANCGATDGVSTWVGPKTFSTVQVPVTLPYSETFEGASGWTTLNENQANKWFEGTAANNGGTRAMYISNDNGVSNAYTITSISTVQAYRDVQIPAGVNQVNFGFDWRAVGESTWDYLRVWLVPTSFVPTAGTQITAAADRINLTGNFNQQAAWGRRNMVINVGAFAGQTGRFVFEWRNDGSGGTQPPGAIDNIDITIITCPAPTAPTVTSVTQSTATVQWTAGASETAWEIVVQPAGSGAPTGSSIIIPAGTNPFTITGLNPSTNYEYYVRANCGAVDGVSFWAGPRTFITSQIPATIPYTEGFEGTSGWSTVNGTAVNKWFEGTAVNNGGTRAMYISNDNGVTNAYTITSTSIVHTYRDIAIPATCTPDVNLSFDWRSMGQSAADFLNVWVVPTTYNPVAGTAITAAASGGVQLSNQLINGASFATLTYLVNAVPYAGQNMRVIFEWRNNASGGTPPPAAVDNFNVTIPATTCPRPFNLTVVTPTPTGATVSWTPGCTETAWEIITLPAGSPAPTAATAGTPVTAPPPYTITGLQNYTAYDFYVRAVCIAGTDVSTWSAPKAFTTLIGNDECATAFTVPVNSNAQCTQVRAAIFNGATVSTVGGTTCGTANSGDIWFQFTATNTSHTIDFRDYNSHNIPIMMTLYSGDCGALNQIGCSYNNSITKSGLTIGATYYIRASINTVTTNNNIQFVVCVKTPVPPASGVSSSCLINTVNPSFEEGVLMTTGTSPRWSDLYDHMFLGWRTTASDHHMEIWPTPNTANVPAHTGTKFLELNATLASGVYQDFETPITTVFSYRYAHRARAVGNDVCRLLAGPPGGPYVEIDRRTSSNTAWTYPAARNYTVPAGQTVTRFIFEAVSAASGDATIGNFLDSIEFTADNSIVSATPLSLDCTVGNTTTVVAAGAGQWSAAPGNPAATVIASPDDNTTTISGFSVSGTYTFNWTTLYCTSSVDITYTDNGNQLPTFTAVTPVCAGTTLAALPTTSNEGITGTWSPALDNTTTTEYTFTPTPGQCAVPTTMTITVTPNTTPTFTAVAPICAGATLAALPTTSENGINGTWSPALDNTTTTTYTFTPDPAGPCAVPTTMTITVTPNTTPTFAAVAPICAGDVLAALPTTSTEGVTGTWSPALDNTTTTEYTFTPDAGQCAVTNTMTITVNPNVTPTFAAVTPICAGDALTALPTTSTEGVTGTWTPALDNTTTTTYTFTPDAGQCAVTNTMTITVNPVVTPTFAAVAPICEGATLAALPTTSTEGVTGTWLPALDNTTTTTYTFTPDAGQCSPTTTMTITVNPSVTPTFAAVAAICEGETLSPLPTTSNEGITGTWAPALDNMATTTYTFTPDSTGPCALPTTMTITVNAKMTPVFVQVADICTGEALAALPTTSEEGITGTWSPAVNNTATTTYTFTPDAGQCALPTTMTIAVNDKVEPIFDDVAPICPGEPLAALPTTSENGVSGTWSPALNNMTTTTYTFTPDAGQCAEMKTMDIVVTASCDIPRGISPNGDGKNDALNLDGFNVSKLSIFNRYGMAVYKFGTGYKDQWHGQSDKGQELPDGTYYYVIEMGTNVTKTGWIYINREQ